MKNKEKSDKSDIILQLVFFLFITFLITDLINIIKLISKQRIRNEDLSDYKNMYCIQKFSENN